MMDPLVSTYLSPWMVTQQVFETLPLQYTFQDYTSTLPSGSRTQLLLAFHMSQTWPCFSYHKPHHQSLGVEDCHIHLTHKSPEVGIVIMWMDPMGWHCRLWLTILVLSCSLLWKGMSRMYYFVVYNASSSEYPLEFGRCPFYLWRILQPPTQWRSSVNQILF